MSRKPFGKTAKELKSIGNSLRGLSGRAVPTKARKRPTGPVANRKAGIGGTGIGTGGAQAGARGTGPAKFYPSRKRG
jgi:hypothetical protein